MTTDTRWLILSQEQTAQGESLGELRRAVTLMLRRLEQVEQEVATLKAAWVVRFGEGADNVGISS